MMPKHKSHRQSPIANRSREAGVTLIVAMVMLASVTFISFALSAIILREIVGTRLILRTEPAISGANAGGEVGLYHFIRESGSFTPSGPLPQSGASYTVSPDLYDNPYLFAITGPSGRKFKVALYDALNPNNTAADYGTVTIRNSGGSAFRFVVISSDGQICASPDLASNQSHTCALNSADDRYVVEIEKRLNSGVSNGEITTTNEAGEDKGVPSNEPELEVSGQAQDAVRKIEIRLRQ